VTLAWSTLVASLGLLPGFFFFLGLTLPERFTREAVVRSPLSHVAVALLTSVIVHLILLFGIRLLGLGEPNWELVLRALLGGEALSSSASAGGPDRIVVLAAYVEANALGALSYVVISSAAGTAFGWFVGIAVVNQWAVAWRLAQHRWLFKLRVPRSNTATQTIASAVTSLRGRASLREETLAMVVQGPLHSFGVGTDGQIRYLVLQEPIERFYVQFSERSPTTTALSSTVVGDSDSLEVRGQRIDGRLFYLAGEHIENIVFEQSESVDMSETGELRRLDEVLAEVRARQAQIEEDGGRVADLLRELGSCMPRELSWRACVFAWDGDFLSVRQHVKFEDDSPELGLRLVPGEGAAGTAAVLRETVEAFEGSEPWVLTSRNQDLVRAGVKVARIIAVPFGEHPSHRELALGVLTVDLMEPATPLQIASIRAGVERQADVLEARFEHVFSI